MYGFEFNGQHTFKDFGITISEKDIGYPEKKKIKVEVPFSNVEYDFSELYGEQTYTPRTLSFVLNVFEMHQINDTKQINLLETRLANWLMNTNGQQRLYDDSMPGYYYLAEVEGGLDFDELWNYGTLTVEFVAYPFIISEYADGDDLWDPFNFELDVAQLGEFEVNGTLNITLFNSGAPSVSPEIEVSSDMEVIKDDVTYKLSSGTTTSDEFRLLPGENELTIKGNGTIKFKFYKELI